MRRCLYCYQKLDAIQADFHPTCSKKMFDQPLAPVVPFSELDIEPLALEVIQRHTVVTGVQEKLSLHLTRQNNNSKERRFTIVGLWGGYILKPPTERYPQLPEVEDVTMHLASAAKIKTAPHSLIRLTSDSLAYITKRIDRTPTGKLAMEDMCQLTERPTEEKYNGSYEQIGKAIQKYSATPGLDVVNFFELVLFSFLVGNADMHLKNFSLIEQPGLGMTLSPAYDLVNTAIVNPQDKEEMALTVNRRKRKLTRSDFVAAMDTLHVDERQQRNIFTKLESALPAWMDLLDSSLLSDELKSQYKRIIQIRLERIC